MQVPSLGDLVIAAASIAASLEEFGKPAKKVKKRTPLPVEELLPRYNQLSPCDAQLFGLIEAGVSREEQCKILRMPARAITVHTNALFDTFRVESSEELQAVAKSLGAIIDHHADQLTEMLLNTASGKTSHVRHLATRSSKNSSLEK